MCYKLVSIMVGMDEKKERVGLFLYLGVLGRKPGRDFILILLSFPSSPLRNDGLFSPLIPLLPRTTPAPYTLIRSFSGKTELEKTIEGYRSEWIIQISNSWFSEFICSGTEIIFDITYSASNTKEQASPEWTYTIVIGK